jgi:hypothetical protein
MIFVVSNSCRPGYQLRSPRVKSEMKDAISIKFLSPLLSMLRRTMVVEGIMEKEEGLEEEQALPDNLSLLLTSSLSFGGSALILSSSSFSLFNFNSLMNRMRHSWNAWGVRGVPRVRAASACLSASLIH